ncbi:MAG: pyridoxine 5'-phosphate synthase [Acetobacteraceae bacterium]|nr:pyridoxine 5'-phosphate synthase [Acetobacteraceae bacterium]
MTRLSVNLNKIALLRNSRHTGVPDPVRFAGIVHAAGAAGITLHPRPDERHVRCTDIDAIAAAIAAWRPAFELNLEGYPDERFLAIVRAARPEQITLVPDKPNAFTSDAGWKLDAAERAVVAWFLAAVPPLSARVILFCDPDADAATRIADTGAQGLEIYTGDYAHAHRIGRPVETLAACAAAAEAGRARGLVVNAGHDLNTRNLPALVHRVPWLHEVSIGHELTADALETGMAVAIGAYKDALIPR